MPVPAREKTGIRCLIHDEFFIPGSNHGAGVRKRAPSIPPGRKNSLFVWAPAKTAGPPLFFIREILDMTGIRIEETGDVGVLRFEIRVPKGGYRFS